VGLFASGGSWPSAGKKKGTGAPTSSQKDQKAKKNDRRVVGGIVPSSGIGGGGKGITGKTMQQYQKKRQVNGL